MLSSTISSDIETSLGSWSDVGCRVRVECGRRERVKSAPCHCSRSRRKDGRRREGLPPKRTGASNRRIFFLNSLAYVCPSSAAHSRECRRKDEFDYSFVSNVTGRLFVEPLMSLYHTLSVFYSTHGGGLSNSSVPGQMMKNEK